MALLEIAQLTKSFGGLTAVDRVSIAVEEGEILGLIGPNGAGKTTIFNVVGGVYPPDQGRVVFKGEDISLMQPHEICRRGLTRTFQLVKPFANLTVLDNVMVGAFKRTSSSTRARRLAAETLSFIGLEGRGEQRAKDLTTADRKRLELARALATKPELLLLDEIMAGLTPKESTWVMELLHQIRDDGITLFVIEHVMHAIMTLSDRIAVLHHGQLIADGTPEDVARDPQVIEAYLGEAYHFA